MGYLRYRQALILRERDGGWVRVGEVGEVGEEGEGGEGGEVGEVGEVGSNGALGIGRSPQESISPNSIERESLAEDFIALRFTR